MRVPVVDYLCLDEPPRLRGHQCAGCGEVFLERRNGCARCGGRAFAIVDLPTTGTLRTFTIVVRGSRNGPFVSAVVELDDGTSVKANLVDVEPDAAHVPLGGRVELVTFPAGTDTSGAEAVAFGFRPEGAMRDTVWIVGAAMTPFGKFRDRDVLDLATTAVFDALDDASLAMSDVGVMAAGSQFETIAFGQRVQKQVGQTGIPVYNVNNACATGATALRTVIMAIRAGEADVGLAVGAEQMTNPGTPVGFPRYDREHFTPSGRAGAVMAPEGMLGTGQMFGVFAEIGIEYARQHDGVGPVQFARVAEKNHAHAVLNPLAQHRDRYTLEQIMDAEMLSYPNTLLMSCPIGDGAAAAIVVSDARMRTMDPDVRRRAVRVAASVLTTDPYTPGSEALPDVNTLTRNAADAAYEAAGVGPTDLDLVELHDCFATAELVHYDNLRLCEPGGAGDFIDSGAPRRDGRLPVNVSGGLLSKGHPIGATGIANVYEVVTQLRGEAGDRQLPRAKVGLTHVIGLGSACSVHVLERGRT